MTSRARHLGALTILASALTLGACIDTLEPSVNRFGLVTYPTSQDEARGYIMDPEAVFYDRTDLQYTPPATDSCVVQAYAPPLTAGSSFLTVSAGEFLVSAVGTQRDTMRAATEVGALVYRPTRRTGITFTPGDSVRLEIPGTPAGFPRAAVTLRTAEAFTFAPVDPTAALDQDLDLSWSPAPVPGSLMTVALRYANARSNGPVNEQVFCGFADDGRATIRADLLAGWRANAAGLRETRFIRLRSVELRLDDRNTLTVLSSFSVPTPTFASR